METLRESNMRNLKVLTFLSLLLAIPLRADEQQSYISYDDGGTIVRQTSDGRETEGRVNLPIYAGDEIVTGRRGRTEVVLADGNVLALDRSTAVGFTSIAASFGSDDQETIIHLRYGKAMFYRAANSRGSARFDTEGATYFAAHEAMFSVETSSAGADRVVVFDGEVEVRTPDRNAVLRRGDSAQLDNRGVYSAIRDAVGTADDFERWFVQRAERFGGKDSRYLDHSLSYAEEDLNQNGSWVNISSYGWAWRPHVATGWRPYYYGHWGYGYNGCLTWVSYEPWGWVPYHYGRWAYDAFYGWFWVPGAAYSPAWVYWWYGPGYVGWAPAGWYDCYRPYYGWAYSPYARASVGFGFYGRVHAGSVDLRPWTFVDSTTMVSNRVDRAAYTTDAIRSRLMRDNEGFGTISSGAARFTREEFRDPAAAINRRLTPGTRGGASGTTGTPDVTPFFRRDNEVPSTIRDRVARSRPTDGTVRTVSGSSGGLAPIGRGSVAPIGGGNVAPIGGGSLAPVGGGTEASDRVRRGNDLGTGTGTTSGGTGSVTRGGSSSGSEGGTVSRGNGSTSGGTGSGSGTVSRGSGGSNNSDSGTVNRGGSSSGAGDTAGRVARPRAADPVVRAPETPASGDANEWRGGTVKRGGEEPGAVSRTPESQPSTSNMNSWRGRTVERSGGGNSSTGERSSSSTSRGSDVPRRVIDGIGGARVRRSDDSASRDSSSGATARSSSGSRDSSSSSKGSSSGSRDSSSSSTRSSGNRDSSSSSSGGSKVDRSSSGSSSSSSSGSKSSGSSSEGSRSSDSSSGGSRSNSSGSSGGGGGRVQRGQ